MVNEESQPIVQLTRWLKATPQRVFRSWTDPNQVSKWLSPTPEIELAQVAIDARVGGSYRLSYRNPDTGHINVVLGQYVEFDPPNRLVITWAWQPPHDGFPESFLGHISTVTIDLVELDGGTQITLTHQNLPSGEISQRHVWGWNGALDQLETFVKP